METRLLHYPCLVNGAQLFISVSFGSTLLQRFLRFDLGSRFMLNKPKSCGLDKVKNTWVDIIMDDNHDCIFPLSFTIEKILKSNYTQNCTPLDLKTDCLIVSNGFIMFQLIPIVPITN